MKKIVISLLLALIGVTLYARGKNLQFQPGTDLLENSISEITISRVRVFLDDVEITSSGAGELDEMKDGTSTPAISVGSVLSFTKFKAGKKMTLKALEKEVQQTQLRLMNSGYFYNATVEIVPPRKNPERRTIIINVTTGFLNRFGGGGIYALFGKVALGGKRNQLIGIAGWNVNGASYIDENLFGLPLIAGASAYTNAPACFSSKGSGISFNGTATLGGFITPDLRFCVDALALYNTKSGFIQNDFIVSPYLFAQFFVNSKMTTTTEARLYCKPAISTTDFNGELCQTFNYSPVAKLNFAALVCSGVRFGNKTEVNENFTHDLSLEHNAVSSNSGMNKRCIRSGYDVDELLLKNYVMASFEARWKAADFVIAGTFPCNIRPFIFADVAVGQYSESGEAGGQFSRTSSDLDFLDAYGLGIQFNFDCPVFAYFNFAYGFNHLGKGKFSFYTRLSF